MPYSAVIVNAYYTVATPCLQAPRRRVENPQGLRLGLRKALNLPANTDQQAITVHILFFFSHRELMPPPVEAHNAPDHTYTTAEHKPLEALLFGRVHESAEWNSKGHSVSLDCPADVPEDVGALYSTSYITPPPVGTSCSQDEDAGVVTLTIQGVSSSGIKERSVRLMRARRFVAELDASEPAALAFSIYGKHFLPAPDSAGKTSTHIFANEYEEPFESIIFGCEWTPEGRVINVQCPGSVSDVIRELFNLQIAQISFAVQSDFFQELQANRFPKIKAPTDNPPWRTIGGTCIDIHVGHDNSDGCILHKPRRELTTSSIPTPTQEWPVSIGQWIVAREFHVTASEMRVPDFSMSDTQVGHLARMVQEDLDRNLPESYQRRLNQSSHAFEPSHRKTRNVAARPLLEVEYERGPKVQETNIKWYLRRLLPVRPYALDPQALRLMSLALIVDNVCLADLQINAIHLHSASIASASGLARVDLT
ncbi:hypothetical protein B0H17DRAFT_1136916 [Mycena rosella]|uniref:Uncharacterized protein n=1 Tax=Mycena rosella TaxID=1033263 RepID=A0AAD7D9P2_MYCRO|nr:hypothetical protein B0H17DRAFT_1136916 [Mycena rosella]